MPTIKYQSRNIVPARQQAVYLGTLLSDTIYLMLQKSKPALLWQSKLVHAFKNLGGDWHSEYKHFTETQSLPLSIPNSKLMYGLETICLTQGEQQNEIDAFQIKCVRRIIKIPPIFIEFSQANQAVRDQTMWYGNNLEEIRNMETAKVETTSYTGRPSSTSFIRIWVKYT